MNDSDLGVTFAKVFPSFTIREFQKKAVEAVLQGRDTIVVVTTGQGPFLFDYCLSDA